MPNGSKENAITLEGGVRNAIIGQPGAGNVIVTDEGSGILLREQGGSIGAPHGAQIASNKLGVTISGDAALGRMRIGISRSLATGIGGGLKDIKIGGEGSEGNQIVALIGVLVAGQGSSGNMVASNTIGLLADGTLAFEEPKDLYGIVVYLSHGVQVTGNTVGGQVIGVVVGGNENELYENKIGTNPPGTAARPNVIGVLIPDGIEEEGDPNIPVGDTNTIGTPGKGNVISGNNHGIVIGRSFSFSSATEPSKVKNSQKRKSLLSNYPTKVGALKRCWLLQTFPPARHQKTGRMGMQFSAILLVPMTEVQKSLATAGPIQRKMRGRNLDPGRRGKPCRR